MSSKRSASEAAASAPPKKKLMTQFEPIKIGPIYSLEEMDMKVLQFQNRKLVERIEQRRKAEEEQRKRIEQLEQRQTTDDAVLCIVNRYWNQLDEDVRILLQRFDAEGADESGKKNESTAVTSFLTLLSQWDRQEIEETLSQRVEFSKRAICKLLQAYDRLLQRNEKLWTAMKAKDSEARKEAESISVKNEVKTEQEEGKVEIKKEPEEDDVKEGDDVKVKQEPSDEKTLEEMKNFIMTDTLKEEVERLLTENKRIQELSTELHHKNHELNLKNAELSEKCAAAETETAELKNQVEDLEYHLDFANQRVDKLDRHLSDALGKLHNYQEGEIKVQGGGEGVSKNKFNEIVAELEEQRELATNRLTELEKLQHDHQEALKVIEKLKMDLSTLPESVIVDTTEYKCLQSQFSVLYNESMQMKTQLEEARNMLANSKNTHLLQIEQMESDELECQKKLRTEVIQLEDQLAQVRREYEMLRIEFEQTLAANEQTGPINREMRNLISSLKNHNEQLKGEVLRFKTRLKEASEEISKRIAEHDKGHSGESNNDKSSVSTPTKDKDASSKADFKSDDSKPEDSDKESGEIVSSEGCSTTGGNNKDEERSKIKSSDAEHIKELKTELKKSQDRERELKLLLDISKSAHKDSRDKVQLMGAERKARAEVEDLRQQVRRLIEAERREKRKLADDEALRAIKKLDEAVGDLKHKLAAQKQEEETLLTEMEVTGLAFEDMQEQNIRLLQQLREKDDANFKLMSERIKWNQIQKLLREEKDVLAEQVGTLQTQVDAQMAVVRQLEDKERILQNTLATIEKELGLRQQALELHKRKAVESAQTAADLKLLLDKYHSQLKEAQLAVADKTSTLQQQNFKYKRIQEEVASLRRKVERAKKIEMASSADEVLLEEIREYKEQLTCPSCKVKKKDAVLTKCFHVFCLECLKTRYETRQRKCPKCNATFGANDYHRIYLE